MEAFKKMKKLAIFLVFGRNRILQHLWTKEIVSKSKEVKTCGMFGDNSDQASFAGSNDWFRQELQ